MDGSELLLYMLKLFQHKYVSDQRIVVNLTIDLDSNEESYSKYLVQNLHSKVSQFSLFLTFFPVDWILKFIFILWKWMNHEWCFRFSSYWIIVEIIKKFCSIYQSIAKLKFFKTASSKRFSIQRIGDFKISLICNLNYNLHGDCK